MIDLTLKRGSLFVATICRNDRRLLPVYPGRDPWRVNVMDNLESLHYRTRSVVSRVIDVIAVDRRIMLERIGDDRPDTVSY
jgi:hypothetical protein